MEITVNNATDTSALAARSEETQQKLQNALAYAQTYAVVDAETYAQAFELIRLSKQEVARLQAEADALTKPLYEVIERINAMVSPRLQAASAFEQQMRAKAVQYSLETEARKHAAVQAAQVVLAAPVDDTAARQAFASIEAASVPKVQGVSYRTDYVYEVTDESLLEDCFVKRVPDKAACAAYAKLHKGDPAANRPGLAISSVKRAVVRG